MQKQENKNIKNVGMACQVGRDDIKVEVNIQSSIPTSFYTTVHSVWKKKCWDGALYIYLHLYSVTFRI